MMRVRLILNAMLLLAGYSSFAQQQGKYVSDTVFGDFPGVETYAITVKDSTPIKRGNYTFNSNLLKEATADSILFKELKISGVFANNKKQENWTYRFYHYTLEDITINRSWNASLNHELNGFEDVFSIPYQDGSFQGKAYWKRKELKNGRYKKENLIASVNHHNDTLIGKFFITKEDIEIRGQLTLTGFLDGELYLKYNHDGVEIQEVRTYDDGFLIEIRKTNATKNEEILAITFDDVIEQLQLFADTADNQQLEISDHYFGSKFNFAYQQRDARIVEQLNGNQVLDKHLLAFDSIHNTHYPANEHKTILKLTRRFQFIYDDDDDSLLASLPIETTKLKQVIDSLLNQPTVILRKNYSDTIYQQYEVLSYASSKLSILNDVLEKITGGYFDFRFRDKYYENGIPGLDKNDTVFIQANGTEISIPLQTKKIDGSDDLLLKMSSYRQAIKELSDSLITSITQSLTVYQNQETIDSLDRIIAINEQTISELYGNPSIYEAEKASEISFSQKFSLSVHERILDKKYDAYLSNSLPQNELIALGGRVICIQHFLIDNQVSINEIETMKQDWNDSLFTTYRDNPFDFRKLETKTLEGIQSSSTILLIYYANQLLNAKNCEQLSIELQHIKKLDRRVKYLVKNQKMEKVQQLNKAVRREQVPNRIERFLEL